MTGWPRVDEKEKPWEAKWSASAREFLRYDTYELGPRVGQVSLLGPDADTYVVSAGEAGEVIGEARVSEYEVRVFDRDGTEIVSVGDRGRKTRAIFSHQDRIGTIRARAMNWLRRPTWAVTATNGEIVASVREETALGMIGRRAWLFIPQMTGDPPMRFAIRAGNLEIGRIRWNRLDLMADSERRIDRKLLLAAWIALRLDPRIA